MMATLPPRKNPTPTRISKQHLTPLQTLLQMGFPKHRAEKALSSTGNRSVQLASDWLLAHVNDPKLDESTPREYILYACPTGPFLQQLENFWSKSREICGWNGAHNFMPHITLVSFFKAPDECGPNLTKTLKQIVDMTGALMERPIKLELYTSHNFMGFFVAENDANFLKRIALQYVKEVSSSTISLEPHVKSLHLTLAYQFPASQFNSLKVLVESLELSCASSWELRLYSRDSRLGTKQVHKVLYPHTPRESDELELRIGDYIYLNGEAAENSCDGWVEGISWLTGMTGYLPENYTERTAESDAWTMHRIVQLCKSRTPSICEDIDVIDGRSISNGTTDQIHLNEALVNLTTDDTSKEDSVKLNKNHENWIDMSPVTIPFECGNDENISLSEKTFDNRSISDHGNRKIYIMRHGERVDFTFGTWIPYCFDEFNNYVRKDLNMPKYLPKRKNCPEGWQNDSPLTNIGLFQAQLTGEAMFEAGIRLDSVYCSPSYRCIQTCTSALEGLKLRNELPLNIEPGLFEWMAWYPDGVPDWCSKDELSDGKYNINKSYKEHVTESDLKTCTKETTEQFYERNYDVLAKLIKETTGNLFIVAHAATLDTCTRQLIGKNPRCTNDLRQVIHKIPYCSLISAENVNEEWKINDPICLPVTHSKNLRFDWNVIVDS